MEIGAVASTGAGIYQAQPRQAEGSAGEETSESQSEKTREAAIRAQNGNTISVEA